MSSSESFPPPRSAHLCPRCGSGTAHPFTGVDGVCLRCAGERVFASGSGSPFAFESDSPAEGAPAAVELREGEVPTQIGPYEIIEELGRGGMGRVYAARQRGLGRIVALKVLPVGRGAPLELELRFLREAQTIARLRHPNIVAIHDSGRTPGHVYFSMDYITGGDLARRLRSEVVEPRDAARLVAKVADALAHAHAEGVLHRDLKPSNILLDGDEPKLADFGLAAQLESSGDFTGPSGLFGTPHYLAPEALQRGGTALSQSSDLYALGVVLYALLTGRTPFAGASPAELPALINHHDAAAPRLLAPAVPRDLETICLKCLEREPARRYANAAALAADLRHFLAGEPIAARPVSAAGQLVRWCRRRPALAAVWLLVSALALGSTLAALGIARERTRAENALAAARQAEATGRDRLRAARLGEARAVRRTTTPGRRAQALAALAEAAQIRPGPDLRDEAAAALLSPDLRPLDPWNLALGVPAQVTLAPGGDLVAIDIRGADGMQHGPALLRRRGEDKPFARIAAENTSAVGPLRFSPDGALLMARYLDETLRLWRIADAQLQASVTGRALPGPQAMTEPFNDDYDFTPDSQAFVLGLAGGGFSLHRASDAGETARWSSAEFLSTLRVSPDGRHVAGVDITKHVERPRAFVVALPGCTLEHTFELRAGPSSLAWSSDSRLLAVALDDNTISIFDARDGRLAQHTTLGTRDLWAVSFAGAGDLLLAGRGHGTALHFADVALGRIELVLDGMGPGMLRIPPFGHSVMVASLESVVTRWAIDPPTGFRILPPPRPSSYGFGSDNCGLDFSRDGRWVVSGHGRYTLIREVATGRLAGESDTGAVKPSDFPGVAFNPEATAIFRGSPADGFQRLAFTVAPDGRFNFAAPETLDAEPGFLLADRNATRTRFLFLDPNGGFAKVVDLTPTGARVLARWPASGVYAGVFSPDGQRVILNFTGMGSDVAAQRIRVHRATDGAPLAELAAPVSCDVNWSADGSTVMTSNGQSDGVIWNAADWTKRTTLSGELGGNVTTFTLSADGALAAIAHDQKLHLVSTRDGARLLTLEIPGASGLAATVRFLPDGRRLAILWRDARIDILDPVAIREALAPLGLGW